MKTKKICFLLGVFSFIAFMSMSTSCKKEEDNKINPEDTAATFTFLTNGTATSATAGTHTLTHKVLEGHVWKQLDIVANSGTNKLTLTSICGDFQNPPIGGVKTKKYFNNPLYSTSVVTASGLLYDFGGVVWFVNAKTYVCSAGADNSEFVEITSCDNISKKVSGKFNFKVKDIANMNDSLVVSGSFNNQNYIVLN